MKSLYPCVNRIRSHKTLGYALFLAVMLATLVLSLPPVGAGTLDPPADAVTETGAPAPTRMKALDQIPPTWSRILPASMRFKVLTEPIPVLPGFKAWGVLDHETGLVWEKSPMPETDPVNRLISGLGDWLHARGHCLRQRDGGRFGWRLPSVHELLSLVGPLGVLPVGHPFDNVSKGDIFWSATTESESQHAVGPTFPERPRSAWQVGFKGDLGLTFLSPAATATKDTRKRMWCVRGGGPLSEY